MVIEAPKRHFRESAPREELRQLDRLIGLQVALFKLEFEYGARGILQNNLAQLEFKRLKTALVKSTFGVFGEIKDHGTPRMKKRARKKIRNFTRYLSGETEIGRLKTHNLPLLKDELDTYISAQINPEDYSWLEDRGGD
ncbi:hypothetical protein HY439_03455 [Candidatus Microgenomates bacterium]|nr:hypothetical protein [Candidatus Microgenomates bacterium]